MRRMARGGGVATVIAGLATGLLPAPGAAQEDERVPTIPAGVAAVLLPVQETRPTAGGAWLGGAESERATVDLLNAELAFAFGEEKGAEYWAFPEAVRERLRRNPMIRVDAGRLSYHGLLRKPEERAQIYEPLHTQLRQIAALFNARVVVLPLSVYYRPPTEEERLAAAEAGAEPPMGRAVLLTAVIDVRRSAVLWHGTIEGEPGEPSGRGVLTTLALNAAGWLVPS
jgi:hypothetical protein